MPRTGRQLAAAAKRIDRQDRANVSRQGRRSGGTGRPTGNTAAAALRRLRDQRPDLHRRVLSGALTAHAAMVAAGFRVRPPSQRRSPLDQILTALPQLAPADLVRVAAAVDALRRPRAAGTAVSRARGGTAKPARAHRAAGQGKRMPRRPSILD